MLAPAAAGFLIAPMVVADAEDCAAYASLPESNLLVSSVTRSSADIVPMIERCYSGDPNAPLLFSVREQATARFIASVGFHSISALSRTAEITYTVHPEKWGRGVGTQVCNAAVRWAFGEKQWVRVQATTLEQHKASQRILHKCGFELEGRLRNFRLVRGVPSDFLLFSILPGPSAGAA